MLEYIRGILTLFVLMTLLLYLIPGEKFQKYIRFFTELVLTLGFVMPVLSLFGDSEKFMKMIDYEEFTESLSEISRDSQRMEFLQNDYYLKEYETAIEGDIMSIAESYGFTVNRADAHLTEDYTLDSIELTVSNRGSDEIVIGKIMEGDLAETGEDDGVCTGLKEELAEYYRMDQSLISIRYQRE